MQFRFYHQGNIRPLEQIPISEDIRHHVANVMKLKDGDEIICFNGEEEWLCKINGISKKLYTITPHEKLREEKGGTGLKINLMVSIVKNDAMHEIISNGTQLGATTIQPIISQRSAPNNIKTSKLQTIANLSAAQCNRITVPAIQETITLQQAIKNHQQTKTPIVLASEALARENGSNPINSLEKSFREIIHILKTCNSISILVGPEGGFTREEHNAVNLSGISISVSLGKNILRSQTAVTAIMQTLLIAQIVSKN